MAQIQNKRKAEGSVNTSRSGSSASATFGASLWDAKRSLAASLAVQMTAPLDANRSLAASLAVQMTAPLDANRSLAASLADARDVRQVAIRREAASHAKRRKVTASTTSTVLPSEFFVGRPFTSSISHFLWRLRGRHELHSVEPETDSTHDFIHTEPEHKNSQVPTILRSGVHHGPERYSDLHAGVNVSIYDQLHTPIGAQYTRPENFHTKWASAGVHPKEGHFFFQEFKTEDSRSCGTAESEVNSWETTCTPKESLAGCTPKEGPVGCGTTGCAESSNLIKPCPVDPVVMYMLELSQPKSDATRAMDTCTTLSFVHPNGPHAFKPYTHTNQNQMKDMVICNGPLEEVSLKGASRANQLADTESAAGEQVTFRASLCLIADTAVEALEAVVPSIDQLPITDLTQQFRGSSKPSKRALREASELPQSKRTKHTQLATRTMTSHEPEGDVKRSCLPKSKLGDSTASRFYRVYYVGGNKRAKGMGRPKGANCRQVMTPLELVKLAPNRILKVEPIQEESCVPLRIWEHKKTEHGWQYLVEWKGYPETKDYTWQYKRDLGVYDFLAFQFSLDARMRSKGGPQRLHSKGGQRRMQSRPQSATQKA